ncbi:MAG: fasciclin domain-containing protein, partial [Bdellovibrionales bacterium]
EYAVRLGCACNCDITNFNYFNRKHYFYPDLPKGYQITQHATPVCTNGTIEIIYLDQAMKVSLHHIHLEDDAGKSTHDKNDLYTLVDLNRAGSPLLEMVTMPVLKSAEEAAAFLSATFCAHFAFAEGQDKIKDDVSQKDIVKIAVGSKDHTTLVTALAAGDRVDTLANPGPFTVFAPTNAAFDKLPKGTVDGLLKPESKDALVNILEYHVFVGVLTPKDLTDGRTLNQVNGDDVKITVKNGKTMVNNATVIASVRATNGYIHIVDQVLLPPPAKK